MLRALNALSAEQVVTGTVQKMVRRFLICPSLFGMISSVSNSVIGDSSSAEQNSFHCRYYNLTSSYEFPRTDLYICTQSFTSAHLKYDICPGILLTIIL